VPIGHLNAHVATDLTLVKDAVAIEWALPRYIEDVADLQDVAECAYRSRGFWKFEVESGELVVGRHDGSGFFNSDGWS
jgi:hypothetical protein